MKSWMLLKIALHSLRANALRSLLTMLGIIIGVSAVISMVSIGDGAKARVSKRIQKMGTNLLVVRPGQRRFRFVRSGSMNTLVTEDAQAIAAQIPGVKYVSPELSQNIQLKYLNENTSTVVLGTTAEYLPVNGYKVAHGRFFNASDVRANRKVVVLGATVTAQLFGKRDPVGKDIKIKGINFTVIGALEAKGQSGYRDPDDQVLIPLRVAQLRVFGVRHLRAINIQVSSQKWMDDVQDDVKRLLRQRHRLAAGVEDDFNIRNQKEILDTMNEVTGTFTLLLASIALVSLLVGGIGIMNIMLVSVTERTREIGIRKAVGARTKDILRQFLVEALLLSVIGGLIGVGLGVGASWFISSLGSWQTQLSLKAVVMAFSFAVMVGVFFGIYPAQKAARLNPIEALRYE